MSIGIFHYLMLSIIIYSIGMFGILLNRRNILAFIMSIEIVLLSVNINFILFANYWNNYSGHIFVIVILTISAAELAVVLAALFIYIKQRSKLYSDEVTNLKG